MARIEINGQNFVGSSVNITNGRVSIDGKAQESLLTGIVEIRILDGELHDLRTDASVTCGKVKRKYFSRRFYNM